MQGFGCSISAISTAFDGTPGGGDWPLVLDFENGSYTSASETYALEDVWEPDSDYGGGGDLGKLVNGVGFVFDQTNDNHSYRFADAFSELVQAGPIVVFDFSIDTDVDGSSVQVTGYDIANFNFGAFAYSRGVDASFITRQNGAPQAIDDAVNGDHKISAIFSKDRIAVSIDGGAVVGLSDISPDTFDRIFCQFSNTTTGNSLTLRSATFRDPAEGEAALPGLST